MAALTYKKVVITGLNPQLAAADVAGETFPGNGRGALLVHNGGASSINVIIAVPGTTKYGQAEPDVTVAVPAGAYRLVGPFDAGLVDGTDNSVHVTYSDVTSVERALIYV